MTFSGKAVLIGAAAMLAVSCAEKAPEAETVKKAEGRRPARKRAAGSKVKR